jgi:hypothetical protein
MVFYSPARKTINFRGFIWRWAETISGYKSAWDLIPTRKICADATLRTLRYLGGMLAFNAGLI